MVDIRGLWSELASGPLALGVAALLLGSASGCIELADEPGNTKVPESSGGGGAGSDGAGGTPGPEFDPSSKTAELSVICSYNVLPGTHSSLPWELTVDPAPIEAGAPFSVSFEGAAMFPESLLDTAQALFEAQGGVKEVNLIGLRGTVLAYAGATGAPAILTEEPIPYRCELEDPPGTRPACDPLNDLPGGPGLVGNTDCAGESASNPCGRFLRLPTSDQCEVGGTCWNVGREEAGSLCDDGDFCKEAAGDQCATIGFCITGALRLPMKSAVQEYAADSSGEVLFGWHEPDHGGAWEVPPSVFQEPLGPIALRFYIGSLEVALECVLGGDQGGNAFGPTPDSELISFPILDSACVDGTRACPGGFKSIAGGECRLSAQSELVALEDLEGPPTVCQRPTPPYTYESFLPIDDPSVLASPTLGVRATIEAKNLDDAACLARNDPIANIEFWDEDQMKLANVVLIFNQPTEVSVSEINPLLRSTAFWPLTDVVWSSGPEVCCERTFQTFWEASVAQCEGW